MKLTYDSNSIVHFTQTSSSEIFKKFKRSMMKIYTKAFFKEVNAFLSFFNHFKNLKLNRVIWKRNDMTYWNLCIKDNEEDKLKQLFFFITEQLKTNDLKKIHEYEKYNIKIKLFVDNANILKNILFLSFHEFDWWDTNNDFYFDIVNINIIWLNAECKKVKKNFNVEKNHDEIKFI
jgi:hypothetical protein